MKKTPAVLPYDNDGIGEGNKRSWSLILLTSLDTIVSENDTMCNSEGDLRLYEQNSNQCEKRYPIQFFKIQQVFHIFIKKIQMQVL